MVAIGLNAVLLGVLAWTTLDARAHAQPARTPSGPSGIQRDPGRYIMVSGGMFARDGDAVYVLDTLNHELVALSWDVGAKRVAPVGFRDVTVDQRLVPGR